MTLVKRLLAITTLLLAEDLRAEPSHAIAGLGLLPCDEALGSSDSTVIRLALGQWAWGFVSGINSEWMLRDGSYRDISRFRSEEELAQAVLAECKKDVSFIVMLATTSVFDSLPLAKLGEH